MTYEVVDVVVDGWREFNLNVEDERCLTLNTFHFPQSYSNLQLATTTMVVLKYLSKKEL